MDIHELSQFAHVFEGCTERELRYITQISERQNVAIDQYILHEHDVDPHIYLIEKGKVAVLKHDPVIGESYLIDMLSAGTLIGEISLIDNKPHSASVKATEETVVIAIPTEKLRNYHVKKLRSFVSELKYLCGISSTYEVASDLYNKIIRNSAQLLVSRLRSTNDLALNSLRNELLSAKARNATSQFMINVIVLLSFYILAVQFMIELKAFTVSTTFITVPMLIILAVPLIIMMKQSGYPLSTYGLTLNHWRSSLIESLIFTIPFFAIVVAYKWLLLHYSPHFADRHLFDMTLSLSKTEPISFTYAIILISCYILFVPVQELLTRGALQSSFQLLLTGQHVTLWAVLLSNLIFSTLHSHISLGFGLIVYIPGLFWGWLYARQHTLLGVTVSHLLLGAWSIFVVGLI